ncbi:MULTISPECIES: MFS transporter [unclassified Caballeronia]|uniref:MFS transporter n=1 Tax=unclassified Caballeronia TaxID=2646786 RepID=UPI0013EDCC48|nr:MULTISPECIES: MFS transporter [unclassified Caballeronia]
MNRPQPAVAGSECDEPHVRSFRQSLLSMLGLSCIVMMVAIDQTVVGTALPTIVAELKGFDLYAWVATSYLLTSVITVPIFGRLGDWYGRKPLVVAAIVVFTVASVLCGAVRCGAAGSMTALVIFRALQGVGGGMLVGTAFASIPDLFPDPVVRLRWQVLFSSAFGVANAIGPSLGGILSQHYGWRSVFFVNLPVGVASLYLAAVHLPHIRHMHLDKIRLDWRGALYVAVALCALQLLVEALSGGEFDLRAIAYAVAVVTGLLLLIREERRAVNPIVPPTLLGERGLAVLLLLSAMMGIGLFSLLFYVPLLLQGGNGISATRAGLAVTPLVVCITVGTISNTRLVTRLKRPNSLLYLGFALLMLSCAGAALTRATSDDPAFVLAMVAGGVGIGFIMPNLTVFAQQVAGKRQLGIATAMIQSARMIGGMLGTALVGATVRVSYHASLAASPGAAAWRAQLDNPQILMSADATAHFVSLVSRSGADAHALIDLARIALTHALHVAFFAVAAGMLLGCIGVALLPFIRLAPPTAAREVMSMPE